MPTVAQMVERTAASVAAADLFYGHGTETPWDEAVALVMGVTGLPDDQAVLEQDVEPALAAQIEGVAVQRIDTRQPLAYLLGHCQYMGHRFVVRPGVLVPRSPLGYLLDGHVYPWLPDKITHVVDVCAGSGCLGIIAAHLFPASRIELLEIDPLACEVARENVAAHALEARVAVVEGDALETFPSLRGVDLVITNPPYVNAADMHNLPPEYRCEPERALASGVDGLDLLLPIIDVAGEVLAPGGLLLGEAGGSAAALDDACAELSLIWPDLLDGGEGVFLWQRPR
ncbi:MAG: 50S ribosomal protein L3 N(5)-glutamine methyltransferase [Pseudomonadota bacterium]